MGCRELCSEAWRLCRCSPEGPQLPRLLSRLLPALFGMAGAVPGPCNPPGPLSPHHPLFEIPWHFCRPALPCLWPHRQIHQTRPLEGHFTTTAPHFPPSHRNAHETGAHVTTAPFAEALGLPGTFRGLGRSLTLPLEAAGGRGVLLSRGFSEHHPRRSGSISCWTGSEQCAGRTKNRVRAPGGFSKAHRLLVPQLLMSSCHGLGLGGLLPEPAVALPEQAPWQGARRCPSPSAVGRHGTLHGCSQGRPPGPPEEFCVRASQCCIGMQ